ncbi:MAG: hypothetical protein LBT16_02505, partial [Treponema sp.]|nr:hypothetical protein [Treponema sp.]
AVVDVFGPLVDAPLESAVSAVFRRCSGPFADGVVVFLLGKAIVVLAVGPAPGCLYMFGEAPFQKRFVDEAARVSGPLIRSPTKAPEGRMNSTPLS